MGIKIRGEEGYKLLTGWEMKNALEWSHCETTLKYKTGLERLVTWIYKCYCLRKYVKTNALCIWMHCLFFLTYWKYHWLNSSCHCHENNMFMLLVQFFPAWSKKCMLWYMEMKTNIVVLNWSIVCSVVLFSMWCKAAFSFSKATIWRRRGEK